MDCLKRKEKIQIKKNEIIEKIQKFGNWFIPSPADTSQKWYEVEVNDIKLGIKELFKLYGGFFYYFIKRRKNID